MTFKRTNHEYGHFYKIIDGDRIVGSIVPVGPGSLYGGCKTWKIYRGYLNREEVGECSTLELSKELVNELHKKYVQRK